MKSERITFLATPEFKANLMQLAQRQNTSAGELIRGRFEHPLGRADIEQTELRALVADLRAATAEVQISLREGLSEAEQTLRALREVAGAKVGT